MAYNHNRSKNKKYSKNKNRKRIENNYIPTECPVCGKLVRDVATAIANKVTKEPTHFECVVQEIALEEELKENQRICYLGQGNFGIVTVKDKSGNNFTIEKKIPYESHDEPIEWRKKVSEGIKD